MIKQTTTAGVPAGELPAQTADRLSRQVAELAAIVAHLRSIAADDAGSQNVLGGLGVVRDSLEAAGIELDGLAFRLWRHGFAAAVRDLDGGRR